MADQERYSDKQIEELLIKHNGQPTKVATELKVSYVQIWRRIRANPSLYEVQQSNRQKTFQDIANFTVSAVLGGVMKEPVFDVDGNIQRDDKDRIIYRDILVDERTRMEHASRLINVFKGDEGIKNQIELTGGEVSGVVLVDDEE